MLSDGGVVEEHAHFQRKNGRQGAHHLRNLHHFPQQISVIFSFGRKILVENLRKSRLSKNINGQNCGEQDQGAQEEEGQGETTQLEEQTAHGGAHNVADGQEGGT